MGHGSHRRHGRNLRATRALLPPLPTNPQSRHLHSIGLNRSTVRHHRQRQSPTHDERGRPRRNQRSKPVQRTLGVDAHRDHMLALHVLLLRQYFQVAIRQQALANAENTHPSAARRDGPQLRHFNFRVSRAAQARPGPGYPHDERCVHSTRYFKVFLEQNPRLHRQTPHHIHHGLLRCSHAMHCVWDCVRLQIHVQVQQ